MGYLGSKSLAEVTCVEAGIIIGKISEMNGMKPAMVTISLFDELDGLDEFQCCY